MVAVGQLIARKCLAWFSQPPFSTPRAQSHFLQRPRPSPSLWQFLFNVGASLVIEDVVFYCIHRSLHSKPLYSPCCVGFDWCVRDCGCWSVCAGKDAAQP